MGGRALVLSLCLAVAARAQDMKPVYTWTDAEGVQHFTDDPNVVPKNVKARTTEGSQVSVVSSSPGAPRPAAQRKGTPASDDVQAAAAQAQAAAAQAQAAAALVQAAGTESEEDRWRRRFREAREKVRALEDDIEVDRKKVEEVSGMPITAGWSCPTGWGGAVYPPVAQVAVGGAGVVVRGQGAGLGFVAGAGSYWNQGWYWPSVVTTPCWYGLGPEFERTREQLEKNRKALVRAKEELAELERRAALEAVPLEWRR